MKFFERDRKKERRRVYVCVRTGKVKEVEREGVCGSKIGKKKPIEKRREGDYVIVW
jgi:hypothetical protein